MALNPNSSGILLSAGWVRIFAGDAAAAIEFFRRAIRLSPLDPEMGYVLSGLACAHLIAGQDEEALSDGLKSIQENPRWSSSLRPVIVCLANLGRLAEARTYAERLMLLVPNDTISALIRRFPFPGQAFKDRYVSALRAAGMPE